MTKVKGLIRKIQSVTSLLEEAYQSPRLGNKVNPLNELLYIQLSLRTTGPSFERTYTHFKKCFPKWERLGWIGKKEKYTDKVADKIQGFIPKSVRYSLHVNMVAHGRSMCHPVYPRCSVCPILQLCPFGQERTRNMG